MFYKLYYLQIIVTRNYCLIKSHYISYENVLVRNIIRLQQNFRIVIKSLHCLCMLLFLILF